SPDHRHRTDRDRRGWRWELRLSTSPWGKGVGEPDGLRAVGLQRCNLMTAGANSEFRRPARLRIGDHVIQSLQGAQIIRESEQREGGQEESGGEAEDEHEDALRA